MFSSDIYKVNENDTTGEEHTTVDNQISNAYVKKSFGFISIDSSFRQWLIRICDSNSKFDSFILTMILINTLAMACMD
jgi:hypothetical protein